jgi:hypothetical protein
VLVVGKTVREEQQLLKSCCWLSLRAAGSRLPFLDLFFLLQLWVCVRARKATMEYHKTKDILHVMQMLGHRNIQTTLIYTQLINFESDEFHVRGAKHLEEDKELIEAGFQYVTEREGVKIYRKRK